jgi:hypothetical protein
LFIFPLFSHQQERVYQPEPQNNEADDSTVFREGLRQGTAQRGLWLFYNILRTSDQRKLSERMQRYMIGGGAIEYVLEWTTQSARRAEHPREEDRMEARRERLPFSGDKEEGPNLAWVIMWRGIYRNLYGGILPESLKAWGYVFWDAKRMLKTKGKETLVRTWEVEEERMMLRFETG